MESDVVQENTIDSLLKGAPSSGSFAVFPVTSISYYPTDRVANQISYNLYNHELGGHRGSNAYHEIEQKLKEKGYTPFDPSHIQFVGPRDGITFDAEFTLFGQGDSYFGKLDIKRFFCEDNSQMNPSIFSLNALHPNQHKIKKSSRIDESGAHIYTLDSDGSEWSIHSHPSGWQGE